MELTPYYETSDWLNVMREAELPEGTELGAGDEVPMPAPPAGEMSPPPGPIKRYALGAGGLAVVAVSIWLLVGQGQDPQPARAAGPQAAVQTPAQHEGQKEATAEERAAKEERLWRGELLRVHRKCSNESSTTAVSACWEAEVPEPDWVLGEEYRKSWLGLVGATSDLCSQESTIAGASGCWQRELRDNG